MVVVTYCSREKNHAAGTMPASDRYLSRRIRIAGEAASQAGCRFMILSGLFGLLEPARPIPDYDQLLTEDDAPVHARLVERQLREHRPARVVFITRSEAVDPGAVPYLAVVAKACSRADVPCEVVELGSEDPSSAVLAARIRALLD